jgi:Flp pilus assembly protein TadG
MGLIERFQRNADSAQAWVKRLEDERGAALVELALCVPLMCILMFGTVEFSQIIYADEVISGISRQGSNIIARTNQDLDNTVAALVIQGGALNLGTNGRVNLP